MQVNWSTFQLHVEISPQRNSFRVIKNVWEGLRDWITVKTNKMNNARRTKDQFEARHPQYLFGSKTARKAPKTGFNYSRKKWQLIPVPKHFLIVSLTQRRSCTWQTLAINNRLPADGHQNNCDVMATPKLTKTGKLLIFKLLHIQQVTEMPCYRLKLYFLLKIGARPDVWPIVTENTFDD